MVHFLLLQVDSPYKKIRLADQVILPFPTFTIRQTKIPPIPKRAPWEEIGKQPTPSQDFQRRSWHCPGKKKHDDPWKKWSSNGPNLVGGFNPFEQYKSNWESSPIFGVNIKNNYNHHLATNFWLKSKSCIRKMCANFCCVLARFKAINTKDG